MAVVLVEENCGNSPALSTSASDLCGCEEANRHEEGFLSYFVDRFVSFIKYKNACPKDEQLTQHPVPQPAAAQLVEALSHTFHGYCKTWHQRARK
jgi:hypothetical protein